MPRHQRLDCPGVIHHVIARGIERKNIFLDDKDREEFLFRLKKALQETKSRCYAWVLMPNHFHLLIRTGDNSLSDLMRRVLTGYAIYFNRRYRRSGYVYQNRYKSILCQEDSYFLELVRYIHLNPIRARIIKGLHELDRYPWTGHSALMSRRKNEWQDTNEVLLQFARMKKKAIGKYREFVRGGLTLGRREDLVGGGLKRSAGGWEGIQRLRRAKEFWRGDERILGDGAFVEEILRKAEEKLSRREKLRRAGWDRERLVKRVCVLMSVTEEDIKKKGRENAVSQAKGLIAYWGYHELGLKGKELAETLKISRPALSQAMRRGEEYAKSKDVKLLN